MINASLLSSPVNLREEIAILTLASTTKRPPNSRFDKRMMSIPYQLVTFSNENICPIYDLLGIPDSSNNDETSFLYISVGRSHATGTECKSLLLRRSESCFRTGHTLPKCSAASPSLVVIRAAEAAF